MNLTRDMLAREICARLSAEHARIEQQWRETGPINFFVVDDLLPLEWATEIGTSFPNSSAMVLKKSLRELKFISAQLNKHAPILEESIYAFQAQPVVKIIESITGLKELEPDSELYAGGISLMAPGHFLNPHIDNSHDRTRERYRVLNLLYYVSPNWSNDNGGNLELWPNGPKRQQTTITSKFNRLVVMVTHQSSWHSVSRVQASKNRCCVSNYYFSMHPASDKDYFQVTSFRGRPEQPLRDVLLRSDIWLRTMLRKVFPKGVRENPHYYKNEASKPPTE